MEYTQLDCPFTLKTELLTDEGIFEGYGSVFDSPIVHPLFGRDIVRPGAFIDSITSKGVKGIKMLWQHNTEEPIGKWVDIAEDAKGLYVKGQLILDLPNAQKAHVLMKHKVIEGLSIGFDARDKSNDWDAQRQTRTLNKIDLYEVSPVTFPAQSIAKIRSVKSAITTIRQYEDFLRDVGFSPREAKSLASAGWSAFRRDVEADREPHALTGVLAALRDARAADLTSPLFGGFCNATTRR